MNTYHRPPSEEGLAALAALQSAVTKTLEKKRKLGQYAVFWRNGEVVLKHYDALSTDQSNQATGILKAPQAVSLEQMDAAIKHRGSSQ